MNYFIAPVLFLVICFNSLGQTLWSHAKVTKDGAATHGIILSDGTWLLDPIYDEITLLPRHSVLHPDNFFLVEKDGKVGLFNRYGNATVPISFDWIELSNHFVLVSKDGKFGAYSFGGNKLLDPVYDHLDISNFGNYFLLNPQDKYIGFGREGAFGISDTSGNIVLPTQYDAIFKKNGFFETRKNGVIQLFNLAGKEIDASKYSEFEGDPYYHSNRGYLKVKADEKWGVIDSLGNTVLPAIYSDLYLGEQYISLHNQYLRGLAHYTGEIVLEPIYTNIFADERKRFFVYGKDGTYGMLNRKGEKLLPMEYDEIRINRYTIELKKDGKYGLCDSLGKRVLDTKYDNIDAQHDSPVILFYKDGKHGAADWTGREIVPAEYDRMNIQRKWIYANRNGKSSGFTYNGDVIFFDAESMRPLGGLFFTLKEGLWSAVDSSGTQRIAPNYSDIGHSMSFGPLPAQKNGKWGYINEKGETMIPFIYEQANSFNQKGNAFVTKNGVHFVINTKNKRVVLQPEPVREMSDERENIEPAWPVDRGYRTRSQLRKLPKLSPLVEEGHIGLKQGETTILSPQYDEVILSELNIILARSASNWNVFDTSGNQIFELNNVEPSAFLPLDEQPHGYQSIVNARFTPTAENPEILIFSDDRSHLWKRRSKIIRQQAEERGYYLAETTYQKVYFPGGHQEMLDFIEQEMNYPKKAKKRKESMVVYVQAIVEKDGSISTVSVNNDRHPAYFVSEAKRIVQSFPKLKAAQMEELGSVRSELVIPISFDYSKL